MRVDRAGVLLAPRRQSRGRPAGRGDGVAASGVRAAHAAPRRRARSAMPEQIVRSRAACHGSTAAAGARSSRTCGHPARRKPGRRARRADRRLERGPSPVPASAARPEQPGARRAARRACRARGPIIAVDARARRRARVPPPARRGSAAPTRRRPGPDGTRRAALNRRPRDDRAAPARRSRAATARSSGPRTAHSTCPTSRSRWLADDRSGELDDRTERTQRARAHCWPTPFLDAARPGLRARPAPRAGARRAPAGDASATSSRSAAPPRALRVRRRRTGCAGRSGSRPARSAAAAVRPTSGRR